MLQSTQLQSWPFNDKANYYLRSPVLGGAVVSEYDAARTYLDPPGNNAPLADPFPPDGSGDPGGIISFDNGSSGSKDVGGFVPLEAGGARCMLDGITRDCGFVKRLADAGGTSAQFMIHGPGGLRVEPQPIEPLGLGQYRVLAPTVERDNESFSGNRLTVEWRKMVFNFAPQEQKTLGQKCDDKLALIFGGDQAVVSTGHDPDTLEDKTYAGKTRPPAIPRPRTTHGYGITKAIAGASSTSTQISTDRMLQLVCTGQPGKLSPLGVVNMRRIRDRSVGATPSVGNTQVGR